MSQLLQDATALMAGERDYVANCANVAALLFADWNKATEHKINWVGFYFKRSADELVLGPFGGQPAW